MGEYATYQGKEIKIGTCEDLYYLRADQVPLVTAEFDDWSAFRFRFPFPDEDGIAPGGFEDHKRGVELHGEAVRPPAGVFHYPVFLRGDDGARVITPCPLSDAGIKAAREGAMEWRSGPNATAVIQQQRVWGGLLVLVVACGGCGAPYRLPTLADAEPYIVALRRQADAAPWRAEFLHAVADRVAAGYEWSGFGPVGG